jgi:protoporphyrinogen oxidase
MTIAYTLAKQGRPVTLFEAAPEMGGLASAWDIGGIVWDRYYHVTLLSDSNLRALLEELNLDEGMCWKKTRTGFYHDGQLFPFSNALDFARFPLLNPLEKLRLGFTIAYAARFKDWKQLENISVQSWLTQLSGRSVFEKIWLPLLKAKLGDDFASTSATFIWATIQRMYAARRNGLKDERFGYLPGGYSSMLKTYQAALEKLNVDIHLGAAVQAVTGGNDGNSSVTLRCGKTFQFGRTIVTAASPLAAKLCPELNDAERQALAGVPYLGIICASVLMKRPLSNCYITNILDESIPFTGLIEMSALVDSSEFGANCLLYVPHYVRPDHPDFDQSDEELAAKILSALQRMYPSVRTEDVLAVRISKSRYVFPRPVVHQNRSSLPIDTSVSGITVVNSAHITNGTLNANETVALAQREARRLNAQYN